MLTDKKVFPSLPIKISPAKELNALIEKNRLQSTSSDWKGCSTINLW